MDKLPNNVDAWVDFNELQSGQLSTLFEFMRSKELPKVGDLIVVGDFDGTLAQARVDEVMRNGVIHLNNITLLPSVETFTDITDEING